ncbi:MAG TPA: aldo/keto reductase [Kofleriaceae bacterium]
MKLDFGPFVFGGNVFGWTVQREEAFQLLDLFIEHGGRMIDTADLYSDGVSESIIGEWLTSRGHRERVLIATKVAKASARRGLAPANIASAIEDSLRRLRTDHVDLYYAHEDDLTVDQGSYMEAFDQLRRDGKARMIGASNFTPERLTSAIAIARTKGIRAFDVSQDQWNLVERDIEKSLVPVIEREGLKELPYFALALGFLTGKYRPGTHVESERSGRASKYLEHRHAPKLLHELDVLAKAYDASVSAIALAWLKAHAVVGAPIASARTPAQLRELLTVSKVKLAPADVAKLSALTA